MVLLINYVFLVYILFLSRFEIIECILRELTNVDFDSAGNTSGVAVADLDNDGTFEVIVAVKNGPNKIIKFDKETKKYYDVSTMHPKYHASRDETGQSISVCTCDIDGDGVEELYIHNHNDVYTVTDDVIVVPDRLFKMVDGQLVDLFNISDTHRKMAPKYGGYSVACIDRTGSGKYDFIVTTYTKEGRGRYKVFSASPKENSDHTSKIKLEEISRDIGIDVERDGRGILVGPLFPNKPSSDIFITNDNSFIIGSRVNRHDGSNVLLRNMGDGNFEDIAEQLNVDDRDNNGRGAGMIDLNDDSELDLVFTNWLGPTRMFQVLFDADMKELQEMKESSLTYPASSAIVLLRDFDNDGEVDILKSDANGDIYYSKYNEIFTSISTSNSSRITIAKSKLGDDETFKRLRIKGIAVADLNDDGFLEIFISHEAYKNKTFSIYQNIINDSNWIRFMPLTKHGAPARGSVVTLKQLRSLQRRVVIGGDCSFMCQSEPIAHFGVGNDILKEVQVVWPDGHKYRHFLYNNDNKKTLIISYSGNVKYTNLNTISEYYVSAGCYRKWCSLHIFILTVTAYVFIYIC